MTSRSPKEPGSFTELMRTLHSLENATNKAGMARFGIRPAHCLGISVTTLRSIARPLQQDHHLASQLWNSGVHEARILASILDEPVRVTPEQMDEWANDFDSWDLCDQTCMNLFDKTPYVTEKAYEWAARDDEYVKRAGFVIMATSAVHNKTASDEQFIDFLPTLVSGMTDDRNFVKKAVSWSFRQIGKRNAMLHDAVLETICPLVDDENRATRWIARDAVKELQNEKTIARIKSRRATPATNERVVH